MFHIANKSHKYLLLLSMALLVPYSFRVTVFYDAYWGDFTSNAEFIDTLAFILVFGALIARSEYVQRALLALASIWGIANFIPRDFNSWSDGNFENFLTVLLYIGGFAILATILIQEKVLTHFQIAEYINRVANSRHRIFSFIWVVLTALAGLVYAWYTFDSEPETTAYSVALTIAVFVTVVSIFDFIHRFFEENDDAIAHFVDLLNDFSLNTYLTRRISSWMYALIHTASLVTATYLVPQLLSQYDSSPWLLIVGFPIIAPITWVGTYLFIMLIRLIFEYSNALIHVAENTSK